jgi:hypothetical protein
VNTEARSQSRTALDELRDYWRVHATDGQHVPADVRRKIFTDEWSTLRIELLA